MAGWESQTKVLVSTGNVRFESRLKAKKDCFLFFHELSSRFPICSLTQNIKIICFQSLGYSSLYIHAYACTHTCSQTHMKNITKKPLMPHSLLAGVRSEVTGKWFQSKSHTLATAKQPLLSVLIRQSPHNRVSQLLRRAV